MQQPAIPTVSVLDCTLRDGGFYTDWDFDRSFVDAYLGAMDAAGVDIAEVGYRSRRREGYSGIYKFISEAFIDELAEVSNVGLGLMLDAKEWVDDEQAIKQFFLPSDRSKVALVRIASGRTHIASALKQIEVLHDLGYKTTLNLMAWATIPSAEQPGFLKQMMESKADVVYVADSYGGMLPDDFRGIAEQCREWPDRPWGVHLHNNLELAFANALEAMAGGATWVDTSVMGMGRGPGNLKTELFLQHLQTRLGSPKHRTEPVYELIGRHMRAMHEEHRWGPSPPYVLSGNLSVHPTFAQRLLGSARYSMAEVTAILDTLHRSGKGGSFSRDAMNTAISSRHQQLQADAPSPTSGRRQPLPMDDWSQREVLVIGRGPHAEQHAAAINRYIAQQQPVVIECNHLPSIEAADPQAHHCAFIVLSNARRMAAEALAQGKRALIGYAGKPVDLGPRVNGEGIFWERYETRQGVLDVADGCVVPHDVVSMFAIAQALRRGARRISLVGFDGYGPSANGRGRRMQAEMVELFGLLQAHFPDLQIASLLKTSYPVAQRSIYAELALCRLDSC